MIILVWALVSLWVMSKVIRNLLVILGNDKGAIFASFQHYGDEKIYSPVYSLLLWSGALGYLMLYLYVEFGITFMLGILLVAAYLYLNDGIVQLVHEHPQIFRYYPRWYRELAERTTREERRRIAYLWLHLPARTQMRYNTSHGAFLHWLDMVMVTLAR